jgi:DNA-binding HxlR family transcriptional regulator
MESENKACKEDILEFLASKKWMLLILSELYFHGTQRFNELLENMVQVSPKILSKRLKELEERSLLTRKRFNEIPPRVEYTLTEKGVELVKSFKDIGKWAIKWESVEPCQ